MKTKVGAVDFADRMKITKPSRYITPNETIPFKNIMKKVKDSNPGRKINEIMIEKSDELLTLHESLENKVMTITGSQENETFGERELLRGHRF